MVTGPAASSAVRSAGSRSIILAVVAARPAPAPRQCLPVNPRARCLTGPMPLSSAPIRPSLPHSSVTATIPPVAVSEGSAAPIWILPRVLPGVRAASTISVTLLLGQSSTVTLDNPSRTPQPHTLSAACRRSTRGSGSDSGLTVGQQSVAAVPEEPDRVRLRGTVTPDGRQPDRHLVGEPPADAFAVGGGLIRDHPAHHGLILRGRSTRSAADQVRTKLRQVGARGSLAYGPPLRRQGCCARLLTCDTIGGLMSLRFADLPLCSSQ